MVRIILFDFSNSTINFDFNFSWQNRKGDLAWLCNDRIEYQKKVAELHRKEQRIPIQYRYETDENRHIGNQRHLYSYEKKQSAN